MKNSLITAVFSLISFLNFAQSANNEKVMTTTSENEIKK
jgi:hypothetical protein